MRLNKYISLSGVSSRREAEDLIKSATITVNDKVEMDPGYRVSPGDKIKYDEKIIAPQGNNQVVMLNKPAGFITTVKDPLNRKTVMDLVQTNERLFPIGRLDKDTTGLLVLARNDQAHIPALSGWRREVYGKDALRLKRGEIALTANGTQLRIIKTE